MRRMRVFLVLALALSAGGVFAIGTANYLKKLPDRAASGASTRVVVAASDLEVGAEIRAEDVKTIDWPSNALPEGAMKDPAEVVGRGLIAPMVQNELFLPMKLAAKDAGPGLPPAIPPGLRALSVRVNEVIGVAGYVLPGTRVDVVATVSPTRNDADMTSKVILTNVPVLAAGTRLERETDKGKPVPVTVVTLIVDPEQAERLTLASTEGKIQLALRNPLDKDTPNTRGIKPAALLGAVASTPTPRPVSRNGKVAPPPPPPPAPEPETIEVIRGDKRTHESVR